MTDSIRTTDPIAEDVPSIEETAPETQEIVETVNPLDAAYAQQFSVPTSLEASPDGAWLVWLQANAEGALELWLSETEEGSEPFRVDLPFVPVEDRDPESGRLLRGPQFSPDSTRIAITGVHPDGDRTAIWIVPLAPDMQPQVIEETDEPIIVSAADAEVIELEDEQATEIAADAVDEVEDGVEPEVLDDEPVSEIVEEEVAPEPVVAEPEVELAVGGQQPFLLADHAGADRSPRWSPDGEIIAFTSTIDGRDVIALGSPQEPGGIEMLTWSREPSREPQWSRDGKFLAFLRPIGGGVEYHDIWSFSLEAGELINLTGDKTPALRHSIEWVPGRNLIAFVTIENDWLGVSVVNADNKAGWVVTRESGDKTEPRFAADEARMVYTRTEGFTTVLCERSLHSSASVALDPGEGVTSMARWAGVKRVAYAFSAPQRPLTLFVQDSNAKAERTAISPEIGGNIREMALVQPQPLEFKVGPDETFSGLLYAPEAASGIGAVYLPDGPLATRRGSFQPEEQALASADIAVLSPVLHGAAGFGAAVERDLREFANTELEITDIDEAARALGKQAGVEADKVVLVGHGFGGALALCTAGARPGSFGAIVVIDPIVDWTTELANADVQWRGWVTDHFGMPLTHADTYALRTPATFSAVIDAPVIIVQTEAASASRSAQIDMLTEDLDTVGVTYTLMAAPAEPLTATLRRVGVALADHFRGASDDAVAGDEPVADSSDI